MRQRVTGVCLLQTPLDLRKEVQTFHRVLDRRIGGERLDRFNDTLFDRLLCQRTLRTRVRTCEESTVKSRFVQVVERESGQRQRLIFATG